MRIDPLSTPVLSLSPKIVIDQDELGLYSYTVSLGGGQVSGYRYESIKEAVKTAAWMITDLFVTEFPLAAQGIVSVPEPVSMPAENGVKLK